MARDASDRSDLGTQFASADKLLVRSECHLRYSENRSHYLDWLLQLLTPRPDCLLLDLGCGPGTHHPRLRQQRMRIVGVDRSAGMLRAARRQARSERLPVQVTRGDAERLPLPDGCCDRILANHMLYHVPDRLGALREMRRVLAPGGRLVVTTYAPDSGRQLRDLHRGVARGLGYTPTPPAFARFHLGHLSLMQEVFPSAQLRVRNDAFLFPDAESALRYYASGPVDSIAKVPPDGSHRIPLLQMMASAIKEVVQRHGVFRVAKTTACFVAEV